MTTGQITAVTHSTNAGASLTGNRRAHQHFIDTHAFNTLNPGFVNHGTGRHEDLIRVRTHDIARYDTTEDSIAQRFDNVTALNNRRHFQAFIGATISVSHEQILSHVYQATSQITRVSGFQSGIGQTFPRTVSGNKVLTHVETFTEVSGNRRLNDRAIWLGHQAAHTRQLTNLCRATTST